MDTQVIEARLTKLNTLVGKLKRFRNIDLNDYLKDEDVQSMVERRMQLTLQVCLDIGNYLIPDVLGKITWESGLAEGIGEEREEIIVNVFR